MLCVTFIATWQRVSSASRVVDRLNKLKCGVASPVRVDRVGLSFIHVVGNLLLLPAEAREEEEQRSNYLSETRRMLARSFARVPPILQYVRHPAWNLSVRLWSVAFCIYRKKKIRRRSRTMQSDNGISPRWFFCVRKRDIHVMRLVAFYRTSLSRLVSFLSLDNSRILERGDHLITIDQRMKFLLLKPILYFSLKKSQNLELKYNIFKSSELSHSI